MTRSPFTAAIVAYCLFLAGLCLAAAALAGCAAGLSASPTVSAQRVVYTAETGFEAALRLAVAYEQLPPCDGSGKTVCSDPTTVSEVTAAAKAARASLSTAEAAVRSNTDAAAITAAALQAQQDVSAFQTLAATLGK